MKLDDLEYCFKEQIDAGATDVFYYLLEDGQNRTPSRISEMKHTGKLEDLISFLDSCFYVKKTDTTPPMPKFRID